MAKKNKDATPDTFRRIFEFFNAPVMHVDCGQKCAPLNGGEPVCCDTANAIPIMQVAEWKHLRSRSKMWHRFKPYDAASREIAEDISDTCKAVECQGARNCERDNRSLACRTFPFFPYINKEGEVLGLSHYWTFEDRCWVISNTALVEQAFVDEFLKAYATLFADDPGEYQVFVDYSATMRRVFSRQKLSIPLIARNGEYYLIKPKGAGMKKIKADKLPSFPPFSSQ